MQTKMLFSQHYLETRLPQHAEWNEDPAPAYEALRALWDKAQQFGETWSEAQTEDEFIKPALTALGWAFTVQPKSRHAGRVTRPDYALFADAETQQDAYPFQGADDAFYSRVLAIAEAKYWERPLSQKDASGRETWKPGANPSHQMVSYLVRTRAPWGILTNGRVWRLYSREVSSTASEFYEVDLGRIMNHESRIRNQDSAIHDSLILDSFRRFWLFFRRDAFVADAQGKSFVQRVHEGSATYAREISDKLKELVYAEVMPEIAAGFIAYRREQMGVHEETEESLDDIYQASLSLLYKLLFLLYAEARGLLPVENPGYREQSLTALAQWAADQRDRDVALSTATHATSKYDALLALFHRIDQGDPSLGIPRYNGGLFDPENPDNAFLERHRLSDRAVACAVDILVRDAGQPVDYAYISVRNLGAIYEGLLENKLRITNSELREASSVIRNSQFAIQLVNDKGERKATGSYYTPDYIVEYIVQQTLGPVLEARAETFAAAMARVADARRALGRTAAPGKVRLLRGQLDAAERDAREAFLGIKVLDPAMGSGHFLVNAVDFLTDGIIREMQAFHDAHPAIAWDWNPIQQLVERVRTEILDEMARQSIALDPARLDDTALLTRLVMKRCIYGVDLNKMAVELAKLSLWLHSFTVGAPLSFLDHHLRWGNSLIGTDVRTVEAGIQMTDTGQFGLFAGPFAGLLDLTALMVEVVDRADATLSDVQRSAGDFAALQRSLTPYKQALDLWVSQHFGNTEADEFLRLYGNDVLPALRGEKQVTERYRAAIARARDLWEEKRFFHWDLEFPEVFVDLRKRDWAENPGFDAVIGNPPYGSINALSWFPNLQNDVFVYFWKQGIDITKADGYLSFITPAGWLTGINFQSLREVLLDSGKILRVVGLPYDVFRGAYIDTCIVVIKAGESTSQVIEVKQMQKDDDATKIEELTYDTIEASLWYTDPYKKFILLPAVAKLQRFHSLPQFAPLGELVRVERGVQPYSRSKHTREQIQSDFLRLYGIPTQQQQQVYLPELLGEELSRYRIESDANQWLKYSDELAGKRDIEFFVRPRVVLRRLLSRRRELMVAVTSEKFITTDNILNILIETEGISEYYIASLLNSKLIAWLYTNTSTISVKDDFPQVTYEELKNLPIPRIPFTTPAAERARLLAEAQALARAWVQQPDAAVIAYPTFLEWSTEYGVGSMEQHSDVMHDLLASLAEAMLALNKEKQAEMRAFLTWLERHIGAKVDDLAGKTIIQNYLGDYQKGEAPLAFEALLKRLRQNRRKLSADPDARAFQETLEREYDASLAILLPLKQRLAATDRLIDLLVYRLYGLTEEEVGIVEGR
ncbi:MAG: Eco57I restriction-modification methylase domain-containing protein [Anaerolineae bacterium]